MTIEALPRLVAICMALNSGKSLTATDLSNRLLVTPRTVYRDIEFLQHLGIPIGSVSGPGGGYRVEDSVSVTAPLLLGTQDFLSYLATRLLLGRVDDGIYKQALHLAEGSLTKDEWKQLSLIQNSILIDPEDWYWRPLAEPFLRDLRNAILSQRRILIEYSDRARVHFGPETTEPYGLVWKSGAWYLVAHSLSSKLTFRIKVERIISLYTTVEIFTKPENFHLHNYWKQSLQEYGKGDIRVTFKVAHSAVDDFMRFGWKDTSSVQPTTDGIEASIYVDKYDWLIPVVLGYAGAVQVTEPQELIDKILVAVSRLAEIHCNSDDTSPLGLEVPK